jgi:hypothetical protein
VEKGEAKEAIRIEEGLLLIGYSYYYLIHNKVRIGQKPNLLIRDRVKSSYEHESEAKKVY